MDAKGNLADFFETAPTRFEEREIAPRLWAMSMDTEASLKQYLSLQLKLPLVARIGPLAKMFDFVASAAPGVKEIVTVGKLCWEVKERHYDLVVVDASASGHIVGQLAAPQAINQLVQVGLVRQQTGWMLDILDDPATTGLVVVATPAEMPVSETLELTARLRRRPTSTWPRWWSTGSCPSCSAGARRRSSTGWPRRRPTAAARTRARRVLRAAPGSGPPDGHHAAVAHRAPGDAARRHRPQRAPAVHAVPVLPQPRAAGHPPARRRPLRRAGVLMAARGEPTPADPARPETHRGAARGQGDRHRLRVGRGGQDHHGGGRGGHGRGPPRRQGAGGHRRPGPPPGQRPRARGLRQRREAGPPRGLQASGVRPAVSCGRPCSTPSRAGTTWCAATPPTRRPAARILANPLYQNISGKFVQSHDYIAMERLYEMHSEGNFDLIVVDTPPTRNAIDFIEAPQRMAEFFSSRLLRLLIAPYRSRMVNLASRPFYQVADRVLGSQFLEDIAEFFILFQTMYAGFVERARAVERLLHDRRTTFVVVSTLEAAPVREAEFFIQVLPTKQFHLGALVLNRVLPDYLLDDAAEGRAARLCDDAAELAGSDGLAELARHRRGAADPGARRGGRELPELRGRGPPRGRPAPASWPGRPDVVATVPEFDADIHDLAGLLRLGERIWA